MKIGPNIMFKTVLFIFSSCGFLNFWTHGHNFYIYWSSGILFIWFSGFGLLTQLVVKHRPNKRKYSVRSCFGTGLKFSQMINDRQLIFRCSCENFSNKLNIKTRGGGTKGYFCQSWA